MSGEQFCPGMCLLSGLALEDLGCVEGGRPVSLGQKKAGR